MNAPFLHENLSLIEVADRLILDELYADQRTGPFLLTRLGPKLAVVAPGQMDILLARLLKMGHTPKVLEA